jgi:hypothetical protein
MFGRITGRPGWRINRWAGKLSNRQTGACLGWIGGRGPIGRGGIGQRRTTTTFLNGTSVPEIPVQAPARPAYVT